MKVTKAQLQQLIKEEYAKIILESKGYEPTLLRVKILAENLDEGIFDAFSKALSVGKEAYKKVRAEDQLKENEAAKVKTQEQLREEIAGIRMKAKDKLKKNGYVGESEGDESVLAVDLFNDAVKEVLKSSEAPKRISKTREPDVRASFGAIRH